MKRLVPVALFLIAGALGFISCASHPLKSAAPSASVPKAQAESNPTLSGQPNQTTLTTSTQPSTIAQMVAAASAVSSAVSSSSENILTFSFLILALLLLWASLRQLHQRRKPAAVLTLAAPTQVLPPTTPSLHKGVLITSTGAVHLLHAKHNYHPIIPANIKNDIMVTAFYYDDVHKMHFAPNTTVKKVTGWAAYQCQISEEYLRQVYLTLRDHFSPLRATAHLARFVPRHRKHLKLDVWVMAPASRPQAKT